MAKQTLSDLSMVAQGIKEAQANMDQQVRASTEQFRPENSLVSMGIEETKNLFNPQNSLIDQGIKEYNNNLKSQISDSTEIFSNKNSLVSKGIMDSNNYMKSQIDGAVSPFSNSNSMMNQSSGIDRIKPKVSIIDPNKQKWLDKIYSGVGEGIWQR